MDIHTLINSPGLWLASSIMVIVVIAQSAIFLRAALRQAPNVGLTNVQLKKAARASMITAIGPSLSPVIILVSLIAILGAPTTWMRMNDIGAARTELGMANLAAGILGGKLEAGSFTPELFSAALWGMALNNMGWMVVTLICTSRMSKVIGWMESKYDPKWVKLMISSAMLGLFGFLTASNVVRKASPFLIAGLVSAICMLFISKVLKQYSRLQEPALGISMIIGMVAAQIIS